MAVSFRLAEVGDIAAVAALVQSAFRGEASRVGWTTEADLLDGQRTDETALAALVDGPDSAVLLAEEGDNLIGCCQLEQRPDATAYIGMVSVRPAVQASGIGRGLLAEAERRAVADGANRVRMTVIRQRSELIAWYERAGYQRTGETEPFPYGDERYGLPRIDDLEFVVLEKPLTVA